MKQEHGINIDGAPTASFFDERLQMIHWFPKLRKLDVPTPESQPIPWEKVEGELPTWDANVAAEFVENLGGEAFVRSDYKSAAMALNAGSHVHNHSQEAIDETVLELISQHVMMQIPIGKHMWLREWLDLDWCGYARETLHPECRAFIEDGEVLCYHPRLSGFDAFADHHDSAVEAINSAWSKESEFPRHHEGLETYSKRVASEFEGSWSVDFVMDRNGAWWCIDMALRALTDRSGEWANLSAHPEDCEHSLENIYLTNRGEQSDENK